jgi:acyl-CoA reductase-like NAD-dependent aldehyde dehydrogenase
VKAVVAVMVVVVKLALKVGLAVRAMVLRRHAVVALHKALAVIVKSAAKEALMDHHLTDSMIATTGRTTGRMIAAMTDPKIAPMTAAWTEPTIEARAATSCPVTSIPS